RPPRTRRAGRRPVGQRPRPAGLRGPRAWRSARGLRSVHERTPYRPGPRAGCAIARAPVRRAENSAVKAFPARPADINPVGGPYPFSNIGRGGAGMRDYIRKRVVDVSHYIVESRATVRQAAAVFGVSKSTVHKDVTERLPRVSKDLARKVKRILDLNKAERHIRGGEATRRKYRSHGCRAS